MGGGKGWPQCPTSADPGGAGTCLQAQKRCMGILMAVLP
jgi:hypothetical protein